MGPSFLRLYDKIISTIRQWFRRELKSKCKTGRNQHFSYHQLQLRWLPIFPIFYYSLTLYPKDKSNIPIQFLMIDLNIRNFTFRLLVLKTRFFTPKMAYFHHQTQNIAFFIKKISCRSPKITLKSMIFHKIPSLDYKIKKLYKKIKARILIRSLPIARCGLRIYCPCFIFYTFVISNTLVTIR